MSPAFLPRSRAFRRALAAAVAAAMLAGLLVALRLRSDFERAVLETFSAEQLSVARNARTLIEAEVAALDREALLTASALGEGPVSPAETERRLAASLARAAESGVERISLIDRASGTRLLLRSPRARAEETGVPAGWLDVLPSEEPPGRVRHLPPDGETGGAKFRLASTVPGAGSRLLVYEVDAARLLRGPLGAVRSGRTGYAWLLDAEGTFLFHPEPAFVGRSCFTARREDYPGVAYDLIDRIQRERMLAGEEGTGTYRSGWHRGRSGPVEKMIAFSPVSVPGDPPGRWSVAVVAPLDEIGAPLDRARPLEIAVPGLVILVVAFAAAALLLLERRFSRHLSRLVAERTAALAGSEARYRSLAEASEDLILTVGTDGRVRTADGAVPRLLGRSRAEVEGRPLGEALPAAAAERVLRFVRRVAATRAGLRREIAIHRGEEPAWLSAAFSPLPTTGGEERVLVVARDVTMERRVERHLVETEKLAALGTMAAGLAHEINNPVGILLGFADLLLRRVEPGSPLAEDLAVIERQGRNVKAVVDKLLSFARGDEEAEPHCDVNGVVREVATIAGHALAKDGVRVDLDLADSLPRVRGDGRGLGQVVLNLLTNARDASAPAGRVEVTTRRAPDGRGVILRVRDDGEGIPPDRIDRIYDPFFTTKPPGRGTGLGLFVTYGIVTRLGGTIDCRSRPAAAPGERGETEFVLGLPLAEEP